MNKRHGTTGIVIAAIAVVAGLVASTSSGAATTQRTIGIVQPDRNSGAPLSAPVEEGGSAAASALGDALVVIPADGPGAMTSAVKSLIAQHAAAIVVNTDQGAGTVKQVLPALAQARAAGIPTLSYEVQFPGSVWVPQTTPKQYAQALADDLASQMGGRGQYAIVSCRPAETVVARWLKATKAYIPRHYPAMKRVAITYGDTGNGNVDKHMVRRLTKHHRHLRGMLLLCPGEAIILPKQVIKAHKVGKVFSTGNGGLCPPVDLDYYGQNIQSGAEDIVCAGDPVKLGYLSVWAADYLARGNTFTQGPYDVGSPVGTVRYYGQNEELPLGQPLTITKANLNQYVG